MLPRFATAQGQLRTSYEFLRLLNHSRAAPPTPKDLVPAGLEDHSIVNSEGTGADGLE